jgi:hypothetical protein
MSGTLRNVQPGQAVPIQTRNGPRCMTKVPNPTGRTRFKGMFVCNSACGLPTKKPSRKCGGFRGGMMQQYGGGGGRRMMPYGGQGF